MNEPILSESLSNVIDQACYETLGQRHPSLLEMVALMLANGFKPEGIRAEALRFGSSPLLADVVANAASYLERSQKEQSNEEHKP